MAGFSQLFNPRIKILTPVVFRSGVPDILLGLTNRRRWVNRHKLFHFLRGVTTKKV